MDDIVLLQNEFAKLDEIKKKVLGREFKEAGSGFLALTDKNIFGGTASNKTHNDYVSDLGKCLKAAICEEFKNVQNIEDRRRRKWFYSEISKYAKKLLEDY